MTSTFPDRACITQSGWVTGLGHAISFKEISKGQSVSLGLLPSLLPFFFFSSSGRREQGHAVFSWQSFSRDFWGQADLTDVTVPVRRGRKPEGEVVWGWCQGSGNRPADLFGTFFSADTVSTFSWSFL